MAAVLTITRTDHTATELRLVASRSRDAAQVRQLLGLASILEGRSRTEAAAQNGMERQTLRDWVHRYNASGIDGLTSRASPGRTPALSEDQRVELKALVVAGPDPVRNKVVRWPCADLREEVARRFDVVVHESTIGKWLRQLGLTRLQARPVHPKKAAEAEARFKENFSGLVKAALLASTSGAAIEIWFQDEARVGQKGTLTYVWAPVGSRPLMVRDNRHRSAYLFGAICPDRAVRAAVIMPKVNIEAMNEHLKEISRHVARGAHAALVCDGAGWHQIGGRLRVPDNITLIPLPPYSPELNPMEKAWT